MDWMNTTVDVFLESLREKNIFIKLNDRDNLDIEAPKGALQDDLVNAIKQRREAIIDYLRTALAQADIGKQIPIAAAEQSYPLSSAQTRVWVSSQIHGTDLYNIVSTYEMDESIDPGIFKMAIAEVVKRHEILRTVFRKDDSGQARQWILKPEEMDFELVCLDWSTGDHNKGDVDDYIRHHIQYHIFELEKAPLFQVVLFNLDKEHSVLCYNMHHIITDAWSTNILINEVLNAYKAIQQGIAMDLPPLRIQYKDYAVWQQAQLDTAAFQVHEKYWLNRFEGKLPTLDLFTNLMRPPIKNTNGQVLGTYIRTELALPLKDICTRSGGSLFPGLVASVLAILYKYTGQKDIIIGTPVAGREHPDLQSQIGFYINTIALRNKCEGKDSFVDLFNSVSRTMLEAHEHQAYPFDRLVERLSLQRDASRSLLFDVFINFQNIMENEMPAIASANNRPHNIGADEITDLGLSSSKFDLIFNFTEVGETIHFAIEFNRDVYASGIMEKFIGHYKQLLSAIITDPLLPMDQLNYITAEEKKTLSGYTDGPKSSYVPGTVVDMFTSQACKVPDNIALQFAEHRMTYRELDESSNRVANYLLDRGIQRETMIALFMDRSINAIVSILGILKAGAVYIPIDTTYPIEKVVGILSNSKTGIVLTDKKGSERIFGQQQLDTVCLDSEGEEMRSASVAPPVITINSSQLAYVLHTSGSTGVPKGVQVEHGSLMNYLHWVLTAYSYPAENGNFGLFTSLSFDLTFTSLFGPLVNGKMLYIYPQDTPVEDVLTHYLNNKDLDLIKLTPAHVQLIASLGIKATHIGRFIVGGEQLNRQHVDILQRLSANPVIYNEYGPTETTVGCTVSEIHSDNGEIIHIGRPIINTSVYILDEQLEMTSIGFIGELYIGGSQLARGYLHMEDLTKEKFIDNPFKKGDRLYKSGDFGRWLANGNIEYISRKDDQVKIRGYRIELGEIETIIRQYGNIRDVVVTAMPASWEDRELTAYLISDEITDNGSLRAFLKTRLPEYMIPKVFVTVSEFPLTANGKIDRKKLIEDTDKYANTAREEYVAPENEVEARLAEIWKSTLAKNHDISIKESFFELGGHSIKAIKMLAQVSKEFKVVISVGELFEDPTIQKLAEKILNAGWVNAATPVRAGDGEYETVKI